MYTGVVSAKGQNESGNAVLMYSSMTAILQALGSHTTSISLARVESSTNGKLVNGRLWSYSQILSLSHCVAITISVSCARTPARVEEAGADTVRLSGSAPVFEGDSLRVSAHVPREVQLGHPMRFGVVIRNVVRQKIEIHYGEPPQFVLTTTQGQVIWDGFDGGAWGASVSVRQLAPGDSLQFTQVWSGHLRSGQQAPAGSYNLWVRVPAFTGVRARVLGPLLLRIT